MADQLSGRCPEPRADGGVSQMTNAYCLLVRYSGRMSFKAETEPLGGVDPASPAAPDQAPPHTGGENRPRPRRRRKRHFESMRRIEGRLWPRQVQRLNTLRLDLQDQRTDEDVEGRERLTNNTLLRVAVDVLLDHRDALKGNTEEELTESLRQHLAVDGPRAPEGADRPGLEPVEMQTEGDHGHLGPAHQ